MEQDTFLLLAFIMIVALLTIDRVKPQFRVELARLAKRMRPPGKTSAVPVPPPP